MEYEPVDTSGYEAAKDDWMGVPMCVDCGVRHQHNASSDYCLRCEPEGN